MSNTLENLRAEIATLVSAYAKEQYKEIVEHTHEAGHEHGAEVHKERK